mmetsp:Transcript_2383/g.2332  ORF Transcript_2383/g.2332 Transcript_2383/m.2332 type:complete len:186 (+) Transcript_2383:278-835(+)
MKIISSNYANQIGGQRSLSNFGVGNNLLFQPPQNQIIPSQQAQKDKNKAYTQMLQNKRSTSFETPIPNLSTPNFIQPDTKFFNQPMSTNKMLFQKNALRQQQKQQAIENKGQESATLLKPSTLKFVAPVNLPSDPKANSMNKAPGTTIPNLHERKNSFGSERSLFSKPKITHHSTIINNYYNNNI